MPLNRRSHAKEIEPVLQLPILSTKLNIPLQSSFHLTRDRLTDKISGSLLCKLTTVIAPPGFGKSTMVSDWIGKRQIKACWLSLDRDDNDLHRFWGYAVAAMDRLEPGIGQKALSLQQTPLKLSVEQMISWLINDLFDVREDVVLILDDYHVIESEEVHRSVVYFLERLPPQIHLVLISRRTLPFPVGALRAKGQYNEIGVSDLKFTEEELSGYWLRQTGVDPEQSSLQRLAYRTEGWIAGIQLAVLSQTAGQEHVLQQFTGNHRFVADYLMEEVFMFQPPEIQQFLLQTSILERMNVDLCAAVMDASGEKALHCIQELERANLFVVPLDSERYWYRYHHLFADFLRGRLRQWQGTDAQTLHGRASEWFEKLGHREEAIDHALSAGLHERASSLIQEISESYLKNRETALLYSWLMRLNRSIAERPALLVVKAWTELFLGQYESMKQHLARLRSVLEKDGVYADPRHTQVRTELEILEGFLPLFLGDFDSAYRHIVRFHSRADIPNEELPLLVRGGVEMNEGTVPFIRGYFGFGGRLKQAMRYHRVYNAFIVRNGFHHHAFSAYQRTAMCEIDYERNDLDGALQYAEYAIDIAYQHGILGSYVPAVILKSRVLWAKKRAEESMDTLVQAMNYLWRSRLDRTLWYGLLNARLVNCRLSIGDFDCADEWVRQSKLSQDAAIMDNQEVEMITYIRAIAARGRIDEALICAEKLLKTAKQRRQKMTELEAHAWLAILLESKNQSYAGLLHMQQALEIGEREGYLRTFADMPELVPLLGRYVEVRKQHYMPELRETVSFSYVRSILAAAGETAAGTIGESEGGTSAALTTREREVLQQIAAGLSNKEIAARLVLTEGTVKLHLHHIYGKLQVKGRVQAIQRARELRLLS